MGIFSIGVFTVLALISLLLFRNKAILLIRRHLKDIQRTDCSDYDSDKYSKKKYFLRNYFVKKTKEENYNKLNSLINFKNTKFNRHLEEENMECKINKL